MAYKIIKVANANNFSEGTTVSLIGKSGFSSTIGTIPLLCNNISTSGNDGTGNPTDITLTLKGLSSVYDDNFNKHVLDVNNGQVTLNIASQEKSARALAFSPRGVSMYTLGLENNTIGRYYLPVNTDITTAIYSRNPFYIGDRETSPTSLYLSKDGRFIFVLGTTQDKIIKYRLTGTNNLSTAVWDSEVSIFDQTTNPQGLYIEDTGRKLYVANNTTIFEYAMSDAFNIKTMSFSGRYVNLSQINANNTDIRDIYISPEGSKLFVADSSLASNIYSYSLSEAWNTTTANYVSGNNLVVENLQPSIRGLSFNQQGNRLYIVGSGNAHIHDYSLSTEWDLSSATYSNSRPTIDSSPEAIALSLSGRAIFVLGSSSDSIERYEISNVNNLSTSFLNNSNINISTITAGTGYVETKATGLFLEPAGGNIYVMGQSQSSIYQFTLNLEYVLSVVDSINVKNIQTAEYTFNSLYFDGEGKYVYVTANTPTQGYVQQYTLSNYWNVSSASLTNTFTVSQDSKPFGLSFKSDGTSLYILGRNTQNIYQYTLSTPWSLNTASYSNKHRSMTNLLNTHHPHANVYNFFISPSGIYSYYIGDSNVFEGYLSSPWDINTASYGQSFFTGTRGIDYITIPVKQTLTVNTAPGQIGYAENFTELSVPIDDRVGDNVTITNSNVNGTYLLSKMQDVSFLAKISQHLLPQYFTKKTAYIEGSYKKLTKRFSISSSTSYTANLGVVTLSNTFVKVYLDETVPITTFEKVDDYTFTINQIPSGYNTVKFDIEYYTVPAIEKGDKIYSGLDNFTVTDISYDASLSSYNAYLTANSIYKITLDKNISKKIVSGLEILNVSKDILGSAGNINVDTNFVSIDYDAIKYPGNFNLAKNKIYSLVINGPFTKTDLSADRVLRGRDPGYYLLKAQNINSYGIKSPFSTAFLDLTAVSLGSVKNLTGTENIFTDALGGSIVQLIVAFEPINDSAIDYELSYKIAGTGDLTTFNTVKLSKSGQDPDGKIRYVINNIDSGRSFSGLLASKDIQVIVRVVPLLGDQRGIASELIHNVLGKSAKPQGLESFYVSQIGDSVYFVYKVPVNPTTGAPIDVDLSHIDIRVMRGCCTAPTTADYLASSSVLVTPTPSAGGQSILDAYGTFTYLAKTFDTSGNYSDFTSNTCITLSKSKDSVIGTVYSEDDPGANNAITGTENANYLEYYWPSFSNSAYGGISYSYSEYADFANGTSSGWTQGTDSNARTLFSNVETAVYTTQIRSLPNVATTSLVSSYVIRKSYDTSISNTRKVILSGSSTPTGVADVFEYSNISSYFFDASYNRTQRTLSNNGIDGNVFVIWNTNLGTNNNSYALIAGVINTNAIALSEVYYANGVSSGSNNFSNLTIHSGSFELVDVYQTRSDILGNNFEGLVNPVVSRLYARYSTQDNVFYANGNVVNSAFTAYLPLGIEDRSFKHFQLKLEVTNLYPRLVIPKLERFIYFTRSNLKEDSILSCLDTNPKTIDISAFNFIKPPRVKAIYPVPAVNYPLGPVILDLTTTSLTLQIFNANDASLPVDLCVLIVLEQDS